MKLTATIITLSALFSVAAAAITARAPATTEPLRDNSFYDNGQQSLNNVACSNGANGLLATNKFTDFASLPTFPNVGGVFAVGGWNSPECGSCWQVTNPGTGVTIYITAIDTVFSGFDVSQAAMNTLTNGQANQFSVIDVESTQVAPSFCGL
ncbi:Cerato-platanin-domain-containing protein [Lactarius quietus]|nr:Cerato-platanin-domain-containing protein [Lactarius quietus]